MMLSTLITVASTACSIFALPVKRQSSPRPTEKLGRGVAAVRSSANSTFISWLLLGLDTDNIGFTIYRSSNGANTTRLDSEILTKGTNYLDSTANLGQSNRYWVRSVINGKEQSPASGSFTLPANNAQESIVRVPIRPGARVKHGTQQDLEAYRRDGKFLWKVGTGPDSENQNNIEPWSSGIDVGQWDGVTVYDLGSDDIAEVIVHISTAEGANNDEQFIAVLNGKTGALRATARIRNDYIEHGPFAARLGVAFPDGTHPHIIAFMKNRQEDKKFNRNLDAWVFDGSKITEEWMYDDQNDGSGSDGHNTRIIDADGNGKDEVGEIMFVLNGDSTLKHDMASSGIGHCDRWQIAKMDPTRPGLQGHSVLWKNYGDEVANIGRGRVDDIDPNHPGMELWSEGGSGLYNASSDTLLEEDTTLYPFELYNDSKLEEWDPANPSKSGSLPRIFRIDKYGSINPGDPNPGFLGDIFGDWHEEVITTNAAYDELIIFTTDQPRSTGWYLQNAHVDYYIGTGMDRPPKPNIRYIGA
ncbi:polysaccharide lyase family 11 protein [Macroventuria anomochaeta]|uniref:Polysaccharide lyase family 11 protein n=1 Tax=Macroventuria anomochaeta TaxID=301207 RepID=A0ACB6RVR8_9PLEO|nr:polysaccharide lyase family 11 protein [Macroventuria anomochaeta]KAF2625029.1 polysaccharide lyase family 11 protein [Macroventuria anomochaeta]